MDELRSDLESSRAFARSAPVLAFLLIACRSYRPAPLDPASHRDAWHGRTVETASVSEFLARLADLEQEPVAFDPADGLTLGEGRVVALAHHPAPRIARLRSGLAAASAEHAGLWADPDLSVGALRITENVPDRWVLTAGLRLSIPLGERRDAERGLAGARLRAAELRVRETEWSVVHEVERAWIAWSAARLRVEETERLVAALESLVRTASQLAERGELLRPEASLFAVEEARRKNQLARLRGEAAAAELELRARMGLAPETPVELVPSLGPRSAVPGDRGESGDLGAQSLTLARLREEYAVAEEALRHEIAKQVPDLALGPELESDEGQSRVGLLAGLPLPLWNANRRAIAEAEVERELARAAFETEYETLIGRRAAAAARAAALAEQRTDVEAVLIPLVERQMDDALRLVQLGEGTSLVLLESVMRAHETKLDLIETRASEALARAEIDHLTGPPRAAVQEAQEETP